MGIPRPSSEYGAKITAPPEWPEIDEDSLYNRAGTLTQLPQKESLVLTHWLEQSGRIYGPR